MPTDFLGGPDFFQRLVDQSPDATIFADRQGIVHVWNRAAAELFGVPSEEALGRTLDFFIPEHLRAGHWTGFREAVAAGQGKHGSKPLRTRALHPSGKKLYVHFAFALVKDETGHVLGAVATAREAGGRDEGLGSRD